MKRMTIADAPAVLNTNDKAMWVLGFNAALDGITTSNAQQLESILRRMVDLCAFGDVDETTDALGWGGLIKEAKAVLTPGVAPTRGGEQS